MDNVDCNYLNEERKKLWQELRETQDAVRRLNEILDNPQGEDFAIRSLAAKTARAYNRTIEKAKEISDKATAISSMFESSKRSKEQVDQLTAQIIDQAKVSAEGKANAETDMKQIGELSDQMSEKLEELSKVQTQLAQKQGEIEELQGHSQTVAAEIDDIKEDCDTNYTDISGAHKAIFGYTDDEGVKVEGKKHDLDIAYSEIKENVKKACQETATVLSNYGTKCEEFLKQSKNEVQGIRDELKSLLPAGLTAGLSAAYLKKRKEEEDEQLKQLGLFKKSIWGMLGLALVPIGLSIYFLIGAKWGVLEVLSVLPKEVACILPLYLPILWIAVFANKRVNLSKRLIEEYTHKEVVSKTYEGLARQIEGLADEKASKELQVRLLYNTVMLSEKNPGELMKDYSRPDNPILDVLSQSTKLSELVEKLANVPGLDRLLRITEAKKRKVDKLEEAVKVAAANETEGDDVG